MWPDYLFYGKWHVLSLNFLMFNIVEGKANIFGVSPPWAYVEAFIPDQVGLLYPFAIYGLIMFTKRYFKTKLMVITTTFAFNLVLYSFTEHKEPRFILQILPYIIMFGGYGFCDLYQNYKKIRRVLGMVFWVILWFSFVLYASRLAGRPHAYKVHDRFASIHNPAKPVNYGIFTECFMAPHDILLHGTNATLRLPDCMPTITRDNPRTVMAPMHELYQFYLNGIESKSDQEKLDYFVVDDAVRRDEMLLSLFNKYYELVGVMQVGRKLERPFRPPYWEETLSLLSDHYTHYLFRLKH